MSKNILVCANGPSCAEIDYTRVPSDAKIMRMTTFYFEEKYYAGKRVDFYVDYARRIDDQYFTIRTINEKNEYEIDMENTWWTVLFESNPHFPTVKSCTELIQKTPLLAEFRCFYEYYYGQYLPTGMQALALAFCLGFNNIYVAGFDLYSDPNNMYPFSSGERLQDVASKYKSSSIYDTSELQQKRSQTEYEYIQATHPTLMQVKFVQLLKKLFPETALRSVSKKTAINDYIEMADKLYESPWYKSYDKPEDRTKDWYELPDTMPSRRKEDA